MNSHSIHDTEIDHHRARNSLCHFQLKFLYFHGIEFDSVIHKKAGKRTLSTKARAQELEEQNNVKLSRVIQIYTH